jgi:hypothetical protein
MTGEQSSMTDKPLPASAALAPSIVGGENASPLEAKRFAGAASARASLLHTVRVVAWSFLGIRRRADHERDAPALHPLGIVAVGILMAGFFVLTLISIVRWVVA